MATIDDITFKSQAGIFQNVLGGDIDRSHDADHMWGGEIVESHLDSRQGQFAGKTPPPIARMQVIAEIEPGKALAMGQATKANYDIGKKDRPAAEAEILPMIEIALQAGTAIRRVLWAGIRAMGHNRRLAENANNGTEVLGPWRPQGEVLRYPMGDLMS